ncbi:protein FAR1-RELATED SEQUENCE 5-like [Arachis hypogaea]|uniref:protein FAR1-RELATED SEQUENCE 5-like n=1 Tax=Arachis hypogaea TaxID=3818 RepID=UPI000DEC6B4B|nr:protein FAR1-RELATED SEQUENCE 6-like [Arachis hypogaea]
MHAKCVIEDNDEAGIRPNKTFLALANESGGPSNLGYSEKNLRNYITAKLRTSNVNVDVREMMNYFIIIKDINPNFFYAVNLDNECIDYHLRRSSVSTTMCMGITPQRIITDQCKSIFRAIKNVLPDTRHRWCIWHITKKLPHKLRGYRRYRELYDEFNDIVWNSRPRSHLRITDLFDDRCMWVPIFFKGEFWAAMKSTQRSESMHSFYENFLHSRTSLVQFVHKYDNVLGIKEQRKLEDDAADLRGVIPCATTSPIERQFQQEYTTCMFRDVQIEFVKKANCRVSVVAEEGPVVCMKVEEEKLVNDSILCVPYDVHFYRSTQEVHCECNLFESSGVLCCHCLEVFHSYKDFVNDDEETALLHAALEETRVKLTAHRVNKRSETVADSHNNNGSTSSNVAVVMDIQAPSKVNTKGRPKSKRLGATLEKSFKKSARRKNKHDPSVVCPESTQDVRFGGVVGQADPEQVGGFMSLLSSFSKS